jgi:hypothetical protein
MMFSVKSVHIYKIILLALTFITGISYSQDSTGTSGTITIKKKPDLGIYACNYVIEGSNPVEVYWHLKEDGTIYSLRTNLSCSDPLLRESLVFYRYLQFIGSYSYHAGQLRIVVSRGNRYLPIGIHYLEMTNYGFRLDNNNDFDLCQ